MRRGSGTIMWSVITDVISVSVGEPLNNEAWQWYNHVVGDNQCDICFSWRTPEQ